MISLHRSAFARALVALAVGVAALFATSRWDDRTLAFVLLVGLPLAVAYGLVVLGALWCIQDVCKKPFARAVVAVAIGVAALFATGCDGGPTVPTAGHRLESRTWIVAGGGTMVLRMGRGADTDVPWLTVVPSTPYVVADPNASPLRRVGRVWDDRQIVTVTQSGATP